MQRTNILATAVASVGLGIAGTSAYAQYAVDTTFQAVTPVPTTTNYPWSDPSNWTNGVPTGNTLAFTNQSAPSQQIDTNITAYGIRYLSPGGTNISLSSANGGVLTLLSHDSVYDPIAKTAPAISSINTGAQSEFAIGVPIVLGNATTVSGDAYFSNELRNNGIRIDNKVSEFAGQSWGLNFAGTSGFESAIRGTNNSGNYLLNRYNLTGKITVGDGARIRVYNNVLPYGPSLPNYLVNGQFSRSTNGGGVITNAIDGTGVLTRSGGNDLIVGANNGNGNFAGRIDSSSIRLYKVGSGTQSLGSTVVGTNAQRLTWVAEGAVSVDSIEQLGNFAETATLDGGGIKYVGAGETSTRSLNVSFRGGSIEASGTGALVFDPTSVIAASTEARAYGDASVSGTSQVVSNVYGLTGLAAPAAAGKLVISGEQSAITAGTTAFTVDQSARTIDLGAGNVVNQASSGNGAPKFTFTQNAAIDRTLTLKGTSTAANTIASTLADGTAFGSKLGITKSGTGTWNLTGANTYTGVTTAAGGTLALGVDAQQPALAGPGGLDVQTGARVTFAYAGASPQPAIRGLLTTGYANGNFASGQIRSSTLAATPNRTLGYLDNGSGTFTVAYAAYGDTNLDGQTNSADVQRILASNKFNKGPTNALWVEGDFNYDGQVTSGDVQLLLASNTFNQGAYPMTLAGAAAAGRVASAVAPGADGDGIVTALYNAATGNLTFDTDGVTMNGFILLSASGVFTGAPANLPAGNFFNVDNDNEISTGFASIGDAYNLGNVAAANLTASFLQGDLTFTYTVPNTAGISTGDLRVVGVIPEPTSLAALGLAALTLGGRRRRRLAAR